MTDISTEYPLLKKQLSALLAGEENPITNLSQFSALVFNSLAKVNWSGFYLVNDRSSLKLGPFQGQVACTDILFGKGVCGTAAQSRKSLLISDVDQFSGHIACDSRSRSELVCPMMVNGQLIGVFDIDSPELDRFTSQDLDGIKAMLMILIDSTDWSKYHQFI